MPNKSPRIATGQNAAAESAIKSAHRRAFWCAAIVIGFLQIWASRYSVNPDGLSYIELGWAAVWHGLPGLVNGYWSPLYPALLGLVFGTLRPSPASGIHSGPHSELRYFSRESGML